MKKTPKHLDTWGNRPQPNLNSLKRLNAINAELDTVLKEVTRIKKKQRKYLSTMKIMCKSNVHGIGCGAMCEVGKLTKVVRTYDNYECGEGWDTRAYSNEFGFRCSECGLLNRVFKEEKHQYGLEDYFKDVVVEHEKSRY